MNIKSKTQKTLRNVKFSLSERVTGRETGGEEEEEAVKQGLKRVSQICLTLGRPATGRGTREEKRWMAIFCGGEVWVEGRRGMAKVVPPSQVSGHRKRWGWAHKRKTKREGDEWKEKEERGKGFRRKKSLIRLSD